MLTNQNISDTLADIQANSSLDWPNKAGRLLALISRLKYDLAHAIDQRDMAIRELKALERAIEERPDFEEIYLAAVEGRP